MAERDPNLVISSHSQHITRDGVTVEVSIIRLEDEPSWSLEVVTPSKASITWDVLFGSDDEAMAEFWRTVRDEGLTAFLDSAVVIPFPPPRR